MRNAQLFCVFLNFVGVIMCVGRVVLFSYFVVISSFMLSCIFHIELK